MNLFHRKSRWQRVAGSLPKSAVPTKSAVRTGATAVGGIVAAAAASAAVSARRNGSNGKNTT
jgi:hypothetical protein